MYRSLECIGDKVKTSTYIKAWLNFELIDIYLTGTSEPVTFRFYTVQPSILSGVFQADIFAINKAIDTNRNTDVNGPIR